MIEIVPSIIARTYEEFEAMVRKLEPVCERVHLDIIDGGFVPDKTILGFDEVQKVNTKLIFDVHLMVTQPEQYVPQWLTIGQVDRIMVHAESGGDLNKLFMEIRSAGKKAGLVVNPETEMGSILEYVPLIDYIQFMTVHPGSYGRPFLMEVLDRIYDFHDSNPDIMIAVDGGINSQTSAQAISAGASVLISGTYVTKSDDPAKAIKELKGNY